MTVIELVRAVRKRLAVANAFELRTAKARADHYAELWHDAIDRVSVLGAELRELQKRVDGGQATIFKAPRQRGDSQ